jgi:hypothetical protein
VVAELDEREADLLTPLADALAARGATAALAVVREGQGRARADLGGGRRRAAGARRRRCPTSRAAAAAGPSARRAPDPATDGIAAALAAAHDALAS